MADYYTLIRQAVQRSDSRTSEARRAIYERARTALLRQLRGHDPPLSDGEITRQRLSLEDAIRKVESEMGQATMRDAATALGKEPRAPADPPPAPARDPAPPPPRPRAEAPPPPVEPAEEEDHPASNERPQRPIPQRAPPPQLRARAEPPVERRPPPRAEAAPEGRPRPPAPPNQLKERFPPGKERFPPGRTAPAAAPPGATAEDRRPPVEAATEEEEASSALAPRFGRGYSDQHRHPEPEDDRYDDAYDEEEYEDEEDEEDETSGRRLAPAFMVGGIVVVLAVLGFAFWQRDSVARLFESAPEEVAAVQGDIAGASVTEATVDSGPLKNEDRVPQPGVTDAPAEGEAAGDAAAPNDQNQMAALSSVPGAEATIPAGRRSVLYEEGSPGEGGFAYNGRVTWSTEPDQSSPGALLVRGLVDIPERGMKLLLTMRRNTDPNLPASHIIELLFEVPPSFTAQGIANVPGILMKANEPTRGTALAGAAKRATDNYFLIGLSNASADRERNIELIRTRGWIDVPVLYENRKRAILTVEKGPEGERIFAEAFASWNSAAASTTNSP